MRKTNGNRLHDSFCKKEEEYIYLLLSDKITRKALKKKLISHLNGEAG